MKVTSLLAGVDTTPQFVVVGDAASVCSVNPVQVPPELNAKSKFNTLSVGSVYPDSHVRVSVASNATPVGVIKDISCSVAVEV